MDYRATPGSVGAERLQETLLPVRLAHDAHQAVPTGSVPRRVVAFRGLDAGVAEEDRDIPHRHAGQQEFHGERVAQAVAVEISDLRRGRDGSEAVAGAVVIRIVSCDLDHIAAGTQPLHFSRTFVGPQRRTAEQRCLSCCPGRPDGINAGHCLFRILSFLR